MEVFGSMRRRKRIKMSMGKKLFLLFWGWSVIVFVGGIIAGHLINFGG